MYEQLKMHFYTGEASMKASATLQVESQSFSLWEVSHAVDRAHDQCVQANQLSTLHKREAQNSAATSGAN